MTAKNGESASHSVDEMLFIYAWILRHCHGTSAYVAQINASEPSSNDGEIP